MTKTTCADALNNIPLDEIKYQVVDDTCYHLSTPTKVIEILERSRRERLRLVITYGDTNTLEAWGAPERGHVGRSTGSSKIPLLVKTSRSLGGGALLDHCIVKIAESKGGKVLYLCPQSRKQ